MDEKIIIYETPLKNRPFQKYLERLIKSHKDDDVAEIMLYLTKLGELGLYINSSFKRDAIKYIKDEIYELRPTSSRIFFFCYLDTYFVILHGWEKKQNKTDPDEIRKAILEKKNFLKEHKDGKIN